MSLFNFSATISGLHTVGTRLGVAGDNIARRNVPYSEKNRVVQSTLEKGGVRAQIQKIPLTPEEREMIPEDSSNIDYAEEFIEFIKAESAHGAQVNIVGRHLELIKTLVNIRI